MPDSFDVAIEESSRGRSGRQFFRRSQKTVDISVAMQLVTVALNFCRMSVLSGENCSKMLISEVTLDTIIVSFRLRH